MTMKTLFVLLLLSSVVSAKPAHAKPPIVVTISPTSATVNTGATQQFTATTQRCTASVTWTATGGTVTTSGLYTAGATSGTYSVTAHCSTASASAVVTIPAANQGVNVAPGQSIQAAIDANPGGTTITLLTGTHRLTSAVNPKSGDTIVGQDGTIVSGARVLTGFTLVNGKWTIGGQTQQNPTGSYVCKTAYPRCFYPEDVFIDGVVQTQASSIAAVVPGTFFFDYAADTITIGTDPTGHVVETSVTPLAFFGETITDVTLRHFTVQMFASPAQTGAIWADGGLRWLVDDVTVTLNHGTGLSFTSSANMTVSNCHINTNGQIGMGSYDNDFLTVQDTELAYNNYAGYDSSWEAGGVKFSWTRDLIVQRNNAHHNNGKGLWTDGDNIRVLYTNNTASDNTDHGIFHEISYDATIQNNLVERNGMNGIVVASSPNVELLGNFVNSNVRQQQILGRQDYAGRVGRYGPSELSNFYVHDNRITAGGSGIQLNGPAVGDTSYYTSRNNRFVADIYDLRLASATPFYWQSANRTEQQWVAYGQDVTGTFVR